jgi:hypothetical protein
MTYKPYTKMFCVYRNMHKYVLELRVLYQSCYLNVNLSAVQYVTSLRQTLTGAIPSTYDQPYIFDSYLSLRSCTRQFNLPTCEGQVFDNIHSHFSSTYIVKLFKLMLMSLRCLFPKSSLTEDTFSLHAYLFYINSQFTDFTCRSPSWHSPLP